jgi:hypothetical protein
MLPWSIMRETVSTNITSARAAAGWLYLVAAATAINSLAVFKYGRFVDLIVGLSFTQLIDAMFVGMSLEPKGAQWLWNAGPALMFDIPIVLLLLVLAFKVSRHRKRAAQFSFWLYAADTFVFLLMFAASVPSHARLRMLVLPGLAIVGHTVGLFILHRAWRHTRAPA